MRCYSAHGNRKPEFEAGTVFAADAVRQPTRPYSGSCNARPTGAPVPGSVSSAGPLSHEARLRPGWPTRERRVSVAAFVEDQHSEPPRPRWPALVWGSPQDACPRASLERLRGILEGAAVHGDRGASAGADHVEPGRNGLSSRTLRVVLALGMGPHADRLKGCGGLANIGGRGPLTVIVLSLRPLTNQKWQDAAARGTFLVLRLCLTEMSGRA